MRHAVKVIFSLGPMIAQCLRSTQQCPTVIGSRPFKFEIENLECFERKKNNSVF